MIAAQEPPDEVARLAQLRALALLDTDPEDAFDRITRLAQRLFDVPIAVVSLVDEDRQWFKSRQGLTSTQTPRDESFCAHAILGEDVLHVPDALADPRFSGNPSVLGDPNIRFYAGCPIAGPYGATLGTLCVIDREPRDLSNAEARSLRDLADLVEREIAALYLASVDALTGLANRRGFELVSEKLLELCRRRGVPAALLYADLDGLKPINDVHGHDEGDRALREFGVILAETFRASDVVARVGGDEFAVMLSGDDTAGAVRERLGAALDARNTRPGVAYALRASVGTAAFDPAGDETLAALTARADAAMYLEKHARVPSPRRPGEPARRAESGAR